MKKSRSTEEQVAYALRLAESGTPVADACRQIGIAEGAVEPERRTPPPDWNRLDLPLAFCEHQFEPLPTPP